MNRAHSVRIHPLPGLERLPAIRGYLVHLTLRVVRVVYYPIDHRGVVLAERDDQSARRQFPSARCTWQPLPIRIVGTH